MSRSASVLALTSGRLVGAVVSLVTAAVLTRLLSKSDYGLYQQVWLIYNTALPFLMMGLPSGVTYFVPQVDRSSQKSILVQVSFLLGLAGIVLATGTYVLADTLEHHFGSGLAVLLKGFFWFPIFSFPLLVIDVFLIATHRALISAVIAVVSALIQFLAVVVPVMLGYGLPTVIEFLSASALLRLVVFTPIIMSGYWGLPYVSDIGFIRKILIFTLPLGVASILGTLILQTGKILVAAKFSTADFALYDVAARELPFIGLITGSVMAVVTPDFVRLYLNRDFDEILRILRSSTNKTALFLLPLFIFLTIFSKDAVVTLFSEKYESSSSIFCIYLLFLPLRIVQYGSILIAAGKTYIILWVHVIAVPLCFLSCLILIGWLGLEGAAVGTVMTVYMVATCLLFACARTISAPISTIFDWGALSRIALVSSIAGLVTYWLTMAMTHGLNRFALGFLVFGTSTSLIGWCFKDLRKELRDVIGPLFKNVCP